MNLSAEMKAQIVKDFGRHAKDTGLPETQIALLTQRIQKLTEHAKVHHHDFHTRRGLVGLVSQRRKLLKYLKQSNEQRYRDLISRLNLRDTF